MRLALLMIGILAISGCGLTQRLQVGDRSGPGSKTVSAKEPPATLVAIDGSLCRTTARKYEDVKVGDRVWCYWLDRGAGPDIGKRGPGPGITGEAGRSWR